MYARSVKIRMATLELMRKLADKSEGNNPYHYQESEDLAGDCANYVETGGWDDRPGSMVTTRRWVKQYLLRSGYFRVQPYGGGSFIVCWRDEYAKIRSARMLAPYVRRRGKAIV